MTYPLSRIGTNDWFHEMTQSTIFEGTRVSGAGDGFADRVQDITDRATDALSEVGQHRTGRCGCGGEDIFCQPAQKAQAILCVLTSILGQAGG